MRMALRCIRVPARPTISMIQTPKSVLFTAYDAGTQQIRIIGRMTARGIARICRADLMAR